MMKFYADLFVLTPDSISVQSIRRLRWLTIGSLPCLPMITFSLLHGFPQGYFAIPFMIVFMVCFLMVLTVLCARIVNRVWAMDKYLDEWEKDLKRRSMTMAFMVVMYVTIGLGIAGDILNDFLSALFNENPKAIPMLLILVIIATGFYSQIFTQLSLIEPMDEDELERPEYVVTTARSILGILALVVIVISSLLIIAGYYSGHRGH